MKQLLLIVDSLFTFSCAEHADRPAKQSGVKGNNTQTAPILGERINGPAHIRDTVNGTILFTLYDNTLVTCTEAVNGWYQVGLMMDIAKEEFNVDTIRKGRKIFVEGKEVGVVEKDFRASTLQSSKETLAELIGYTFKDNIHPQSIIENALEDRSRINKERSLGSFQSFIQDFAMDKDVGPASLITYMNYENWVDDPSPLLRIQLIFEADQLIGVVHSRSLALPDTRDYSLDRGFKVAFFTDVSPLSKDRFIRDFNSFIRTVD